ncbi:efflux transporter outer membrane subunit [Cellvibrio sp. ARAG 10.3]|uniref:efflux transporter outer membrane subunit n=1 Tax=Cellvibrio sp. ARAG 10.3 TaxID=3451358 RepID=UPI003F44B485
MSAQRTLFSQFYRSFLWWPILISLTACHSISRHDQPDIAFTENWQTASPTNHQAEINREWWASFQSPQLNQLIDEALQQSPDLRIAVERVRQAELQMNSAGASLVPALSVNASSGSTRSRDSEADWQTGESSRVSLGASYEIDLWGRVSANIAAAEASFKASEFDYESARLSLTGAVASGWFQWLALQARIETARENIRIAQRVYDIVDVRYRNGAATAADLARQRTNLLNQSAALPPLELQGRQTRAALAVLIGRVPQHFVLTDESIMDIVLPDINAGVPADIITRRPDLASAEAQLQAADADVAAARAALLPAVQLSASAGKATAALFSLGSASDSVGWSLSLVQTLFDGGRLRNQVKLSESQRISLLEQYRKSIYTALQEVDDALDRTAVNAEQEQRQTDIVTQAQRTLRLTEVRYREGSDDLLALLDAQRSLFQAQDQLAQQRQARLTAAVDLYKALGGGWLPDD